MVIDDLPTPGDKGRIEVEDLESIRPVLQEVIADAKRLPGVTYADIRVRVDDGPTAVVENGAVQASQSDFDCCYGIRVIANNGGTGQAYFGSRLGAHVFHSSDVGRTLAEAVRDTYERAKENGVQKRQRYNAYGKFGDALIVTELAPTDSHVERVYADFTEDPRQVDPQVLAERGVQVTQTMMALDPRMRKAQVILTGTMNRELLVTTEGTFIDQAYARTQGLVFVVAQDGNEPPETHYDALGNMHGLEVFNGRNMHGLTLDDFALRLSDETIRLSQAPLLTGRFANVQVVTDGDFNSLFVHEVCGHPSEADRCLGMETGYAGRSWFFRNAAENQLGRQVASPLLSVYSTTAHDGYGHFTFDAEGVRARRQDHIRDGIFTGFLHSRWTAHVMNTMGIEGQVPNGAMRATNANDVPYIRMTQTGIEAGTSDPEEIIAQVPDGWYLGGKRIPSMSESRENFTISARNTRQIKDGKLGTLFRGGALSADSLPYMMSIWAVGNDVGLYPVFNCGKAVPMQTMYLLNQAPTMGAVGTVIGGRR
jgi:TldD protein